MLLASSKRDKNVDIKMLFFIYLLLCIQLQYAPQLISQNQDGGQDGSSKL